MATRVAASLGIHRKKIKKQRNRKKRFLRKVVHYLRSDNYMYAPLVSKDFSLSNTSTSAPDLPPATGLEAEEPSEGIKKKTLIEKVGEYLTADCFMYAPLSVQSQTSNPPKGPTWLDKAETTSVSEQELTKVTDQPAKQAVHHATVEDQIHENRPQRRSTRFRKTLEHHETVNYIAQQIYRRPSSPGGDLLG